jgi:hypothetical protein
MNTATIEATTRTTRTIRPHSGPRPVGVSAARTGTRPTTPSQRRRPEPRGTGTGAPLPAAVRPGPAGRWLTAPWSRLTHRVHEVDAGIRVDCTSGVLAPGVLRAPLPADEICPTCAAASASTAVSARRAA